MINNPITANTPLKIPSSKKALLVQFGSMILFVLAIQWLKKVMFSFLYQLTNWAFLQEIAEGKVVSLILLGIIGLIALYSLIKTITTYTLLYPDKLVTHKGLLSKYQEVIEIKKISEHAVHQTSLGKMLDYGTLHLIISSDLIPVFDLDKITQPYYFASRITELMTSLKQASIQPPVPTTPAPALLPPAPPTAPPAPVSRPAPVTPVVIEAAPAPEVLVVTTPSVVTPTRNSPIQGEVKL